LERPLSRRTFGEVGGRPAWLGRAGLSVAARVGVGAAERPIYAPPLDGWPFLGGEWSLDRPGLGLYGMGEERARVYAPPFGEEVF